MLGIGVSSQLNEWQQLSHSAISSDEKTVQASFLTIKVVSSELSLRAGCWE
ncbi:hypothetical protein M8C21_020966 [Ambrosia artemisiifolia]|uniref:Uncharacterized protein n=1 Tax=Ambrosia artemisiifolia TaxID=4212 RepID=A0AAD5CMX0_AMBAR|nr:hypothetical protein M8C21_020966 [Ambrosia artemisiifolia]